METLTFWLKSSLSSEIFQKRLSEALCDLPNVFVVADDIVVVGKDKVDHDKNLQSLYDRCNEKCIILNERKAEIGRCEITFMGHKIIGNGIEIDHAKISGILDMPEAKDVARVKRFCGMIQYLSRFMPNLSNDLSSLHTLTKKGVAWNWSSECENALRIIKQKITCAPVLAYYDATKPLVLQIDSSKNGVGAVLLQQAKPTEHASRALTKLEQNWAQIEKEMLAVVFGLERFNQYTCARNVIVHNDHKSIEIILQKSLCQAPKRLQSLIMRINAYNVSVKYVPGNDLKIADALSRDFCDSVCDTKCHIFHVKMM